MVEWLQSSGVDETGLGRWCWVRFNTVEGHVTRVVVVYQPVRCEKDKFDGGSTYVQHRRYYQGRGDRRFCWGTKQIDGVFVTSDIDVVGARFLPFWSSIGDHRASAIDV